MEDATIRLDGSAFHWVRWAEFLRHLGFRTAGGCTAPAVYTAGGNHVAVEAGDFVARDGQTGYEMQVALRLTRRWEGTVKFYAVLLAAFAMPQRATVTVGGRVFTDRRELRAHAEAALCQVFPLDELVDHGVVRPGDGVQFV